MNQEEIISLDFIRDHDFLGIGLLYAQAAVDAIKAFGCEPDTYAWRCWWETQSQ